MRWILASFRRLRLERAATLGVVLLVVVTAFLFALAPRALDAVADRALRGEIARARPADRSIQFIQHDRIDAGPATDDPATLLKPVVERGEAQEKKLPAAVRALIVGRGFSIATPRYRLFPEASDPENIRFRYQSDVDAHIRLVEGRQPTGAIRTVDEVGPEKLNAINAYETMVSRETARLLHLEVGASVELGLDFSDPLIGRGVQADAAVMDVVGIYDVLDERDEYWLNDTLLVRPSIRWLGGDRRALDADILIGPEAYREFLRGTSASHYPLRYTWRYYVDPERLDSTTIAALLVDLRRAQATFPGANVGFNQETAMRGSLLPLVERQRAGWLAAESILTVVGIGPAAVAAAALGLVILLAAQRRRATMALSRGRGASIGQVIRAVTAEGLLLTAPAVAVAALLAVLLIPGGPNTATAVVAGTVAGLTTVLIVASSVPGTALLARGPSRESPWRRVGARRLVAELGVVVLAVAGAWLLRERGIRGASSTGQLAAADPLIAAVPALAGIAAGLIAVRLYPLPLRLLAWLAGLGRGLVPVMAMRRSVHGGTSAPVLIVLLATVAIAAFSAAALAHVDRAAEAAAWQTVGAPYRITASGGAFPNSFEPAALPSVEASADVFRVAVPIGLNGPRHEFIAFDVDDFEAVVGGTPADPRLPPEMHGPGNGGPIPVIVSRGLTGRADGVELGEVFPVTIQAYTLQFRAVEIRDAFPWVASNVNFLIAASDQILSAAPDLPLQPSSTVLRAPAGASEAIRAAVADELPDSVLDDRAGRTLALRTAPAVEAIRTGIGAAAAVAGLYAALAVAAALALAGILRAIEVAHLRTLGLSRREAIALVLVEHGPTVVVAFGVGLAFGLGLFVLLRPGLGLDGLVGLKVDIPLGLDPTQLGVILAAIVAIVVVGMTLGVIFQRNAAPVAAVRRGFE